MRRRLVVIIDDLGAGRVVFCACIVRVELGEFVEHPAGADGRGSRRRQQRRPQRWGRQHLAALP
jgi:hypothetical protein